MTRHDGTALHLATTDGVVVVPMIRRLDPAPAVGDWVAVEGEEPIAVLPRSSLLRRRAADRDTGQVLAANVDIVFLVCGLDRPVKSGRIDRGATLARDAGATPIVVLTKAALAPDAERRGRGGRRGEPRDRGDHHLGARGRRSRRAARARAQPDGDDAR